jgi:hypothetical protein
MDHDAYMNQKYGVQQRMLHYLRPDQMTRQELKAAIPLSLSMIGHIGFFKKHHALELINERQLLKRALSPKERKGTNIYEINRHSNEVQKLIKSIEDHERRMEGCDLVAEGYWRRIRIIRELLAEPLKEIKGGCKTTPLKKICRIHLLCPTKGTRMLRPGDKTLYRRNSK